MPTINLIDKSSSLEQICEANYHKLIRLIPELPSIKRNVIGYASGKPALHIEIIEKAPYTLTLLLSYCFGMKPKNLLEPAVKIRVYLDARMVEVFGTGSFRPSSEKEIGRIEARGHVHHQIRAT